MSRSSPNQRIRTEATSTHSPGGCFTAIFTPLFTLLGIIFGYQLITGETTRPWDLIADSKTSGVHAAVISETSSESNLAPFFTPSVKFWEKEIIQWADFWDLDPDLVATVMQIESCGDPRALSSAGAMGLFQVMPYHFEENEAPYNPNTNATRGLAYLQKALNTYQSVRLAFAGYNGGIGTAAKAENLWPNETIRYTYWGTGIYKDSTKNRQESSRLNEWLAAGGASLCHQAEERLGIRP